VAQRDRPGGRRQGRAAAGAGSGGGAVSASLADREQHAMGKGQSLAAQVERVRFGVYTVPSQTEPGVRWTVIDRAALGSGEGLQCTCAAGIHRRPCAHKAAVVVRRQREARRRGEPL
jgi:hypothetical protein